MHSTAPFLTGLLCKVSQDRRKCDIDLLIYSRSARYEPFLARQEADLKTFIEDECESIGPDIDYASIEGLSAEVRERLDRLRPASMVCIWIPGLSDSYLIQVTQGVAKRMEGMTPASYVALRRHIKRSAGQLAEAL